MMVPDHRLCLSIIIVSLPQLAGHLHKRAELQVAPCDHLPVTKGSAKTAQRCLGEYFKSLKLHTSQRENKGGKFGSVRAQHAHTQFVWMHTLIKSNLYLLKRPLSRSACWCLLHACTICFFQFHFDHVILLQRIAFLCSTGLFAVAVFVKHLCPNVPNA